MGFGVVGGLELSTAIIVKETLGLPWSRCNWEVGRALELYRGARRSIQWLGMYSSQNVHPCALVISRRFNVEDFDVTVTVCAGVDP